jgi:murein DD-endopeptidase MepM/ murein hydrolase activator NlpD
VTKAGWYSGYGEAVIIDHGNGFQTLYGHNSELLVTVGQDIAQGEQIAKMGSTGNSSGNHCHFEIYKNGAVTDPLAYIN